MLTTMLKKILFAVLGIAINTGFIFADNDSLKVASTNEKPQFNFVSTYQINDSIIVRYVQTTQLYAQGWDVLKRPIFWKKMMTMPSDSCVVNIGSTREIIMEMSMNAWDVLSDQQKDELRDSIRAARGLTADAHIYRTRGKQQFYHFDGILHSISEGVKVFEKEGVDPWYAQAILMVESPGKLHRSPAGAYGAFQLMPKVARKYGLTVNRYHDDRKNFDKSAVAASQLIATICIPEAKKILDAHHIAYNEHALWFRLFVMHVYNAGAYNVAGVIDKINPTVGGMQLILQMWVTSARNFRNASQNYSQVTLAALMLLNNKLSQLDNVAQL